MLRSLKILDSFGFLMFRLYFQSDLVVAHGLIQIKNLEFPEYSTP